MATPDAPLAAESAPPAPRRVEPRTLAVVGVLFALGAAWLVWARLTGTPGGIGWGPLDSIFAANADRQIGRPAPLFSLTDAEGRGVALADLRGEVVLVNFWATWCAPCLAEMPELDELAREYAPQGFRVLAVNVREDADSVRRFADELQLDLPLLVDPDGETYKAFRVYGLPTNFLIDREGIIREVRLGVVTRRFLEARLPALLAPAS